jgi:hypothetical protein
MAHDYTMRLFWEDKHDEQLSTLLGNWVGGPARIALKSFPTWRWLHYYHGANTPRPQGYQLHVPMDYEGQSRSQLALPTKTWIKVVAKGQAMQSSRRCLGLQRPRAEGAKARGKARTRVSHGFARSRNFYKLWMTVIILWPCIQHDWWDDLNIVKPHLNCPTNRPHSGSLSGRVMNPFVTYWANHVFTFVASYIRHFTPLLLIFCSSCSGLNPNTRHCPMAAFCILGCVYLNS